MAVSSWPFAGDPTSEDQYSRLFRQAVVDGVTTVGGFNVTAGTGMQVQVAAGLAVVRGHMVRSTATETLSIGAASGQNRIDRIILKLDPSNDEITLEVKAGTPASNPSPPSLTQNDVTVYEISLAQVSVTSSTVNIVNGLITDERPRTGVVVGVGTSAQQPAGGRPGELYFNTTDDRLVNFVEGEGWVPIASTWPRIGGKPSTFPPSSHTHAAADITSGTLNANRIPNLNANKITAGTLNTDRIPTDLPGKRIIANVSSQAALTPAALSGSLRFDSVGNPTLQSTGGGRAFVVSNSSDGHNVGGPVTTSDAGAPSWRSMHISGSSYRLARFTSSIRYKTHVKPLKGALDKILALRPVTFRSKHEADKGKTLTGLIAEEVAEVLPDVVTVDEGGLPDSISLDGLVPYLVAAVQALNARIDELEAS